MAGAESLARAGVARTGLREGSRTIRTACAPGAGLSGSGIAQVSAQADYTTILLKVPQDSLDSGMNRIEGFLRSGAEKGKITAETRVKTLSLLKGTVGAVDSSGCNLVVETITENLDLKQQAFSRTDGICAAQPSLESP